MSRSDTLWSCSRHGAHMDNQETWCDLGCGEGDQKMWRVERVRVGCCDRQRKPCSYHEGWLDGFDSMTASDPVRVDAPTLQDHLRTRLETAAQRATDGGNIGGAHLIREAAERLDTLEAQLAAAQKERDSSKREAEAVHAASAASLRRMAGELLTARGQANALEAQLADAQSDERLYRRSFDNLHEAYELLREESDSLRGQVNMLEAQLDASALIRRWRVTQDSRNYFRDETRRLRGQVTKAVNIVRAELRGADAMLTRPSPLPDTDDWPAMRGQRTMARRILEAFAAAGLPVGGETPGKVQPEEPTGKRFEGSAEDCDQWAALTDTEGCP